MKIAGKQLVGLVPFLDTPDIHPEDTQPNSTEIKDGLRVTECVVERVGLEQCRLVEYNFFPL